MANGRRCRGGQGRDCEGSRGRQEQAIRGSRCAQHEQPSAMPPTTKSTTAQLLSLLKLSGGGCARVRCSRRRLAASCSRHRRCCRRATKRRSTYCSSDGENAAVPTCGAALRVLIIEEVTVFASPFASPSPSSLLYHQCFHLGCESASTWPSAGY